MSSINGSEDNDAYSSEEEDGDTAVGGDSAGATGDKKARDHHNLLERKRRDHIKESFQILKDCLPGMRSSERASRAATLASATTYINQLVRSNRAREEENDRISRENDALTRQLRQLDTSTVPVINGHLTSSSPAGVGVQYSAVPLEHQTGLSHMNRVTHVAAPANGVVSNASFAASNVSLAAAGSSSNGANCTVVRRPSLHSNGDANGTRSANASLQAPTKSSFGIQGDHENRESSVIDDAREPAAKRPRLSKS